MVTFQRAYLRTPSNMATKQQCAFIHTRILLHSVGRFGGGGLQELLLGELLN